MSDTENTAPTPKAGVKLPDRKSFKLNTDTSEELSPGTVLGIDLAKWATAIVDLTDAADRVETSRYRLTRKGFQAITGDQPTVVGFRLAEVWVMPREMYEQRRAMRAANNRKAVISGRLDASALRRPKVSVMQDGIELPIE